MLQKSGDHQFDVLNISFENLQGFAYTNIVFTFIHMYLYLYTYIYIYI